MNTAIRLTLAQATADTVYDLRSRHQAIPSTAVQLDTMSVLARGHITMRRSLAYDVPSESTPGHVHIVSLWLALKRDRVSESWWQAERHRGIWRNEIIGARCSCPNRAEVPEAGASIDHPPCKHILTALALARLEGYRLEVPKT